MPLEGGGGGRKRSGHTSVKTFSELHEPGAWRSDLGNNL